MHGDVAARLLPQGLRLRVGGQDYRVGAEAQLLLPHHQDGQVAALLTVEDQAEGGRELPREVESMLTPGLCKGRWEYVCDGWGAATACSGTPSPASALWESVSLLGMVAPVPADLLGSGRVGRDRPDLL